MNASGGMVPPSGGWPEIGSPVGVGSCQYRLHAASVAESAMIGIRIVRIRSSTPLGGDVCLDGNFSFRWARHRLSRRVLLRTALTVGLLTGGDAAAERALAIELDAKAPFAERELADALRVRIGAAGAPVKLTITTTEHGVTVGARGASRDVELAGRTGADAARLVALAAVDLLFDDLATAPGGPPGLAVVQTAPRASDRFSIGVVGMAAQWGGTIAGGV